MSPALALAHELAHADAPAFHWLRKLIPAGRFGNLEERRVILGPERAAAQSLGEGMRDSRTAYPYSVPHPLSR